MTTGDLEKRHQRLRDHHRNELGTVEKLREAHGLTLQESFVMPAIDFEPRDIKDLGFSKQIQAMKDERQQRLHSLPDDLRAATIKADETLGLCNELQVELIQHLYSDGASVAAIAKRLVISEGNVRNTLGIDYYQGSE